MVKRAHHRSAVRHVLAGTIGTLGALAVSTQVASANHVIVKAGDTVWKIAQEHHATVSDLENANANTIKKVSDSVDLIYAGQQLTLPGNDTTMQADENGRYTVKPGDTLSKIAQNFHVSVATLMAWNGLTSDQLYIGQQLIVNGQGAVVAPAAPVVSSPVPAVNAASAASVAPAVSAAPEDAQQMTTDAAATQTPVQPAGAVQSANADQQSDATDTASANGNTVSSTVDTTNTSAVSAPPASASVATQMTEAAATNSASAVASDAPAASQANTVSASTVASDAAAFATSESTSSASRTSTADTTAPVALATPVSSVAPAASASVAPAPTTPASATASATPQPVASQAVSSATQAPASQAQATSQAPAQSSQAATPAPAQPQSSASQDLQSGSVVSLAVKIANTNSVPYVWGGSSLSGMDCSGLVDYVYANAEGKQLPHNTVALESQVNQHAVSEAQPGDILFWGQHGSTYHCAIYTGNNQFVAAAHPGTNVASYTISPYFEPSFAGTVK